MRDLATTLLRLLDDPVAPEFGALPERPSEIVRMRADAAKAHDLLGWAPQVALEEGLRRTIDWYRAELSKADGSPFAP